MKEILIALITSAGTIIAALIYARAKVISSAPSKSAEAASDASASNLSEIKCGLNVLFHLCTLVGSLLTGTGIALLILALVYPSRAPFFLYIVVMTLPTGVLIYFSGMRALDYRKRLAPLVKSGSHVGVLAFLGALPKFFFGAADGEQLKAAGSKSVDTKADEGAVRITSAASTSRVPGSDA
jgi:hypothetical protein